ncbi:hypothetical protein [Nonomuraea angiospora]
MARKITTDWSRLFPRFTVWKPLRLMRRIGPVLQGITLDRSTSGEAYYPHAHVHALTRDFPVVSLTLTQRLTTAAGVAEGIPAQLHEERFEEAARRLETQSPLPLREAPTLEQIVHQYRRHAVDAQRGRLPIAEPELEDSVLVPAAAGEEALAVESLRLVSEVAAGWSKLEAPRGWDSTTNWLDWLASRMRDVEGLAATVEEQVLKHGLAEVRAA